VILNPSLVFCAESLTIPDPDWKRRHALLHAASVRRGPVDHTIQRIQGVEQEVWINLRLQSPQPAREGGSPLRSGQHNGSFEDASQTCKAAPDRSSSSVFATEPRLAIALKQVSTSCL
jgi:hypothetical protein